ncbi:MAG: ABC transporter permease, partial [bacterium]|nr:ABC transporter permease [bacterium]
VIRRTKEIGIRKVLGASIPRILLLLTREFFLLLGISFAISLPFSLYGIHHWLESFARHINLDIWLFLPAPGLVAMITFPAIVFHVVRTSLAAPVEALRYE